LISNLGNLGLPGMRPQRPLWVAWVVFLGLWPSIGFASIDDEITSVDKQIRLLEDKLSLTRHEYTQFQDSVVDLSKFESRLNDGQSLMLLKDYVRAAIVFFDLVENEAYRGHPSYADALFNLAEALLFNRNFIDAGNYYRKVLDHPRGRPFRKLALTRLMQIALNTNDFGKVDETHQALLKETSTAMPEVEYFWGKTLFLRGRIDEAQRSFSSIAAGQPYFFQARYFLGVTLIRQGKAEAAQEVFAALSQSNPQNAQDKNITELSHLAQGRILHDLGKEVAALDAFQSIEHTSPNFDEALFEICWTYIQRAEQSEKPEDRSKWLLEASRTLEILEVSTPDSTLVPRANLLKGSILQKMGKFEEASQAFLKVGQTYASVKQQLDDLVARHEDPVRYFNEVAGKNLDSFDLSAYLPPVAVKWMTNQNEISAALGVMKDLEMGRRFVAESRALLGKLNSLLKDNRDRINLFPVLADGAKRCLEIENARVIVDRTLAAVEERIVMERVSMDERKALVAAKTEREKLEHSLDALPTTKKQFDSREQRVRERIESLEQSVFQSGIGLKGMKGQLSAMEEWVRVHEKELAGREEDVREFREEIRRGWATANQLQAELDELTNLLVTEKARAGMDSDVLSQEDDVRKRYSEALGRERELANAIHHRLGPEGTEQVSRINEMRMRTERLGHDAKDVQRKLNEMVDHEANKLLKQAELEEQNLQAFDAALSKTEQESQNIAGEVAYKALQEIREKFYRLVLDSDVGLLDVAWSRMQEKGRQIGDLTKKKNAESRQLHKEFKSVLEEVQ
jgi:tetratricopeptide (TPR) repeat protein